MEEKLLSSPTFLSSPVGESMLLLSSSKLIDGSLRFNDRLSPPSSITAVAAATVAPTTPTTTPTTPIPQLTPSPTAAAAAATTTTTATTTQSDFTSQKVSLQHNQQNDAIALILSRPQLLEARTFEESARQTVDFASFRGNQTESETFSFTDSLIQYVNFKLVRKMIAQNLIAVIFVCVIIIYLIYYFSQISRRPKLIGNSRSKFVEFIRKNFKDKTLSHRFSPLIYFWGTNMQTALFGYLQGQSSVEEMPRSEFNRQYLYVSDAQYLKSNVDLSKHYLQQKGDKKKRSSKWKKDSNHQHLSSKCSSPNIKREHFCLVQLEVNSKTSGVVGALCERQVCDLSLLDRNIQLALNDILVEQKNNKNTLIEHHEQQAKHKELNVVAVAKGAKRQERRKDKLDSSKEQAQEEVINNVSDHEESDNLSTYSKRVSTSSGSSSDSGVYAGNIADTGSSSSGSQRSSSTSSSSSSLLSSVKLGAPFNCDCGHLLYSTSGSCHLLPSSSDNLQQQQEQQQQRLIHKEQVEFGQCALDWHKPSHKHYHTNKLVALISAGMTTGSDKKYVTDTVQTLEQLGYEVCVFIRRGVGGLKLSSTKFFSPAKWRDFEAAVLSVREQRPEARLVSIGFSFGSIELCRYLSMSGKNSLISAALLVSCPFDPAAGGNNMRKRLLNRKIDAYLAKHLGKQLHQAMFATCAPQSDNDSTSCQSGHDHVEMPGGDKQQVETVNNKLTHVFNYNGSLVNLASLPKVKSLADFESNYNRILQNYPSVEAYASDCRLQNHLTHIETPTLCLSSEDDFMAPLKLLPLDQIKANKNLCMILTKRGGHMAFIDGLMWPKKPYFAQRIIANYMQSVKVKLLHSDKTSFNTLLDTTIKNRPQHQEQNHNSHVANKKHHVIEMYPK